MIAFKFVVFSPLPAPTRLFFYMVSCSLLIIKKQQEMYLFYLTIHRNCQYLDHRSWSKYWRFHYMELGVSRSSAECRHAFFSWNYVLEIKLVHVSFWQTIHSNFVTLNDWKCLWFHAYLHWNQFESQHYV